MTFVTSEAMSSSNRTVIRKRFPGQFKAMLSICSDLDETQSASDYFEVAHYLNTEESTAFGQGIGIEVGNTIYFHMPDNQFSYWNCDDDARKMIRTLINSGHIDCIHSFGDLATNRAMVEESLAQLAKYNCRIRTWIDHAVAPTNFGSDIMQGQGDISTSNCYHADLTIEQGIEYVWRGRVTSVVGQSVNPSYFSIFDWRRPMHSSVTLLKELTKRVLSFLPYGKYSLHRNNRAIEGAVLRSGQRVFEFIRCNPHPAGVSTGETMTGISEVLTDRYLERLIASGGVSILYTHLGKNEEGATLVPKSSDRAFRNLASYQRRGDILICTTTRLLDYCRLSQEVTWTVSEEESTAVIECSIPDGLDPSGLSFDVFGYKRARVLLAGKELLAKERPCDSKSDFFNITVPWKSLLFPSMQS